MKACFKVIGGIIQQLLFLGLALLARAAGERWVGDWGGGRREFSLEGLFELNGSP